MTNGFISHRLMKTVVMQAMAIKTMWTSPRDKDTNVFRGLIFHRSSGVWSSLLSLLASLKVTPHGLWLSLMASLQTTLSLLLVLAFWDVDVLYLERGGKSTFRGICIFLRTPVLQPAFWLLSGLNQRIIKARLSKEILNHLVWNSANLFSKCQMHVWLADEWD